MTEPVIVWFRQDLRLADQPALAAAAEAGPVVALYVLDDATPGDWRIGGAQRWWLHHSLTALGEALKAKGVPLVLRRGEAAKVVADLAREIGAGAIHALYHYEPWWKAAEAALAKADGVALHLHHGRLLADPDGVRTGSGGRYRMFSAFWQALRAQMPPPKPLPVPARMAGFSGKLASDDLADWDLLPDKPNWAAGFDVWTPGEDGAKAALRGFRPALDDYDVDRNKPSIDGTSRLSPHLHFGEISPAAVWHTLSDADGDPWPFLREIAWRDFASNVVDIIPDYGSRNGRDVYDRFPWRRADGDFRAWTKGLTGYPIVDAGMRQLWVTGWMHNRVRMIAASFLIKHLLIDWRRGERWFWDTLVDADYGNNSVNWQWVAGTGIDSNPFGRIMAPLSQSAKFDAGDYIRRWVPELTELSDEDIHDPEVRPNGYPEKIIGHREGRERALAAGMEARG